VIWDFVMGCVGHVELPVCSLCFEIDGNVRGPRGETGDGCIANI
jgi:hypothetical protein